MSEINRGNLGGYYKISRHYKWALTQMFEVMNYNYVVIVEGVSTTFNVMKCICIVVSHIIKVYFFLLAVCAYYEPEFLNLSILKWIC